MIRLLLTVGSYCLDIDLSRLDDEPEPDPVPPQKQGSTCGVLERAYDEPHPLDSIGFRRNP